VHIASDWNLGAFRLPVQWVNRPLTPRDTALHDFRGFSGQIAGGILRKGDPVMVLPSGLKSRVKEIWTYDGPLDEAFCPQSVTVTLEDEIDISRGDMLVGMEELPGVENDLHGKVCWMNQRPLIAGRKYLLKHGTQTVQAMISSLEYRVNISTFDHEPAPTELAVNDIGEIRIKTARPIVYDGYTQNRLTGSFILIEPGTNQTVAAGMLGVPSGAFNPEFTDYAI
jgi:sulfate adenylyltransferase subunit 1